MPVSWVIRALSSVRRLRWWKKKKRRQSEALENKAKLQEALQRIANF